MRRDIISGNIEFPHMFNEAKRQRFKCVHLDLPTNYIVTGVTAVGVIGLSVSLPTNLNTCPVSHSNRQSWREVGTTTMGEGKMI